jgi:penicillin-binding protein 1C
VLDFPFQTAVKTGTSNDYRDAWTVGFSDRHTAGVWFGNLDQGEMRGVTGSVGPAIVLREVFAELSRRAPGRPLPLSRRLRRVAICAETGALAHPACPALDEWFRPAYAPGAYCPLHGEELVASAAPTGEASLLRPTPGLHLAMDPRIPDALERFTLEVESAQAPQQVDWFVDGERVARVSSGSRRFPWELSRGEHRAFARVFLKSSPEPIETESVVFHVR